MQKRLILIATLGLLATGCSGFQFPGVYKIDIPQGNILEKKQLAQVKPGMTQAQVRYLLGTPLITDTFHPERWDYVYAIRPAKGESRQHRLTLVFEGETLARIEGDALTKVTR